MRDFYRTIDSAWAGETGTARARYMQRCGNALLRADCKIQAAHRKRMAAARKLQRMGVPTIINPRSRAWLRVKLLQERSDLRLLERQKGLLDRRHEDCPGECKEDIIRILRMHGALVYNRSCDGRGYLHSKKGEYVSFSPSREEAREVSWNLLEPFWSMK